MESFLVDLLIISYAECPVAAKADTGKEKGNYGYVPTELIRNRKSRDCRTFD
jgi:hypothetical protein